MITGNDIKNKIANYQRGITFAEAQNKLNSLLGENREVMIIGRDGESVRLSKSSIGKLMSNTAVEKSVRNGFTRGQHYAVVSDIDIIYRNAVKVLSHGDKHGNKEVTIYRLATPLGFDDGVALITVKGSLLHGKRVHTAELMEIERLGGILEEAKSLTSPAPSQTKNKATGFLENADGNARVQLPSMRLYIHNINDLLAKVNSKSAKSEKSL